MDGIKKYTRDGVGENQSPTSEKSASTNHIRALLVGLVHQLGLFLTHSRSSYKARATSILFDQLLRHMNLLRITSRNNREIVLQRTGRPISHGSAPPNFHISLGDLTVNGMGSAISPGKAGSGSPVRTDAALGQAFGFFAAHGIDSLRMTFPGDSDEKIDQLRLTLNIIARYRKAVENSATIVFRYYGRSIRVPVVYDNLGRPDPNLTSMAGLNGISAANARELVKQADACQALASSYGKSSDKDVATQYSSYDLIFSFTSLSAQLIKPQIEINTLPWIVDSSLDGDMTDMSDALRTQ